MPAIPVLKRKYSTVDQYGDKERRWRWRRGGRDPWPRLQAFYIKCPNPLEV
jgi:hypothetical protein